LVPQAHQRPPHRRTISRRRPLAWLALAIAVVALVAAGSRFVTGGDGRWSELSEQISNMPDLVDADGQPGSLEGAFVADSGRPNYRYSVIAGGAYSADELREAIHSDPVVAAHYAGLDASRVRVETVPHDRSVYVSYRKGNEVFWTKKQVLLRKGETILTDGHTQIRARCGNCIATEPQLPTSDEEPPAGELDRPEDSGPAPTNRPDSPFVSLVPSPVGPGGVPPASSESNGFLPPLSPPPPSVASGVPGVGGGPLVPLGIAPPPGGLRQPPAELPTPPVFPSTTSDGDTFVPPGNEPPLGPPGSDPFVPPGNGPPNTPGDPTFPPNGYDPDPHDPDSHGPDPKTDPPRDTASVPEPGTLLLLGAGVAAWLRRSRSRTR
jgi:hypothetical protein